MSAAAFDGERGTKASRRRRAGARGQGRAWTPYALTAPALALLCLVMVYPLVKEFYLSFTTTALTSPNSGAWVGLKNYAAIFSDPEFGHTLLITLFYVAVCTIGAVGTGLAVSLLLDGEYRGRGIARSLVTVPWAAPGVAVALIMTWMINAQYGIVNRVLRLVGLEPANGLWLESARLALPAILVTTIWQLFPFNAVVMLSALQSVPKELKEAAVMDGGTPRWVFRAAIWPTIAPTVSTLVVLNMIWAMRRFDLIWVTTRGGPSNATNTLVINLYQSAFVYGDLGRAAAIGVVGVVISLLLVSANLLLSRRTDGGE